MRTIDWASATPGPGCIRMVDQSRLPGELAELDVRTVDGLVEAITRLAVRGAPALGVAGALGVALALHTLPAEQVGPAVARLRAARPTAVNLAHGVDVALAAAERVGAAAAPAAALDAALVLRDEDIAGCRRMATRGAELLARLVPGRAALRVLTICNTGALAAVEHGTALGVVEQLHVERRLAGVLVCETRPLLQGARLTAWELGRMGATYELIVDSAAAGILAGGGADAVLVGADRIAANGDTANKVGTFGLALAAARARVPFLVVAPETTVDTGVATGADIRIEDRGPGEVRSCCAHCGVPTAPSDAPARNPAFDVTPAELITAIVTDRRVVHGAPAPVPTAVSP